MEDLEKWADGDASMANYAMYVVSGVAGTGKSTIAYEFARRLEQKNTLGATFFFVRGAEKLSTTRFVLPTIAYQLARNQPDLFPIIVEAARAHLRLGEHQQMDFQLDDLIVKPLKTVQASHSPVVIIIDAVDECTNAAQDEVARLLYLLMDKIRDMPFPFRVLVTTRPEQHIENALSSFEFRKVAKPFRLHDIPRTTADSDITQYLEDGFIKFRYKQELIAKRPTAVADLAKNAEGLFIYASTALDFLFKSVEHPDDAVRRLDILLSSQATTALSTHPLEGAATAGNTRQLDNLYLSVLDSAFPETVLERPHYTEWLQDVLGAIALLCDHISPRTLEALAGVAAGTTQSILARLGSLVIVPDSADGEMRPLHASFPQFLINNSRCTNPIFYVDRAPYHGRLALGCLNNLTAPRALRANNKTLSPHLQYSCLYWATHLSEAGSSPELYAALDKFVAEDLLLWFEALSYMKRLDVAAPALLHVRTWYQVGRSVEGANRD